MAARPTFRVRTLGCKANQYDSQRLAEALAALGYAEADADGAPDLILVNTCTVTHAADSKARQIVRRAVREHPTARVFVTGCYATRLREDLAAIDGVAGVYGRDEWAGLMEAIAGAGVEVLTGDFGVQTFTGRTRAFIKIQEGCDSFCTYCIVPHVRGRPRSRPLAEAVAEAERFVRDGFREIVLTGIHVGLYGRDLPEGVDLADAVRAVAAVPGLLRLRVSSLEPLDVTDRLLDAMAEAPPVCAHLHLPLQSGSNGVLARMGRPYTASEFLAVVAQARARLSNPAITTDVLVGFPGETDAESAETLDVCRRAGFSRLHAFPFSPRPGTPAAQMPGQVPSTVVRERMARIGALADELSGAWAATFVGRDVDVLFEERDADGRLTGYSERYVKVAAEGGDELLNTVARVTCTAADGMTLTA